jgi:hypothetical protein
MTVWPFEGRIGAVIVVTTIEWRLAHEAGEV